MDSRIKLRRVNNRNVVWIIWLTAVLDISCHIFYSRRAIDVPDGIPKWEEHKDESKQIPEDFPEHNAPAPEMEAGKL